MKFNFKTDWLVRAWNSDGCHVMEAIAIGSCAQHKQERIIWQEAGHTQRTGFFCYLIDNPNKQISCIVNNLKLHYLFALA